jgi:hypothetical protein
VKRIAAFIQRKRQMDLPVLAQEMRVRQRGTRPFLVTLVYVVALAVVAMGFTNSVVTSAPGELALQGRQFFLVLVLAQLAMISLIVPAYSSVVVTTEREKGTIELLMLTMISSGGIVRQKLSAAIAEILLLTLTSLPVLALVFLFGGVTPWQLILAYCIFVTTALLLGSFGVFCSCAFTNSRTATSMAYLGMFVFMLLLPLGAGWLKSVTRNGLMSSAETFPYVLIGLLVFVGGAAALTLFAVAAVLLKRRTSLWVVRAFRMAVFGGCYGLVLMVIAIPSLSNLAIQVLFGVDQDVSLPMLVNPFVAVASLLDVTGNSDLTPLIVGSTIVFAILSAYLLVNLSVRRFCALRRS